MSAFEIGLASFPSLLVLIFLRVPIGLAMFLVGFAGYFLLNGDTTIAMARLKNETFSTFGNYSLSIVPMFLLMGYFATLGGMSKALFRAAESFLGHRKGGVAMAAISACAGFGSICGSSLATAATMSRVALPELKRYGYSGGFAAATLAAGGTLGILIPPSVVLVIYAILTEQNIAKLFLAAFVPGGLAALGYIIVVSIYVRRYPDRAGTRPRVPWAERIRVLMGVWPVLLVFGLVVGGIYVGWFTPTEGAAVGALGTGIVALVSGGLSRSNLLDSCFTTARSTAMIFFIVFGAAFYNGFLGLTQVPQELSAWVVGQGYSPYTVLLLILVFYLVMGCLMDSLSMILLTIPIFFPVISVLDFGLVSWAGMQAEAAAVALADPGLVIAPDMLASIKQTIVDGAVMTREQMRAIGINITESMANRAMLEHNAIWFGILVLIVVETGLITPPVGMNLFIIKAMDDETPMVDTYKAVMWYVVSDIIRVGILVLFPAIVLFVI